MANRSARPYGSWVSPITVDKVVSAAISLREPRLEGGRLHWIEGRPAERGRQVVVRWSEEDGAVDLTPPPSNARTMAHEYGGGSYALNEGTLYFSNMDDGRVYRGAAGDAQPQPLTPEGPYRFADLVVDRRHDRLLAIREDHTPLRGAPAGQPDGRGPEPDNSLVAIRLSAGADGEIDQIASGHDFYSSPRPSPDGRFLAWLSWDHPNMPWDGCELWLAELAADGSPGEPRKVAGGPEESIVQPEWAPDGRLIFASDRSGWWNLYSLLPDEPAEQAALAPMDAEFAGPQWVFGMTWYGVAEDGSLVAVAHRPARDELWLIPARGEARRLPVPDEQIDSVVVEGRRVAYLGASAVRPKAVVLLDLKTNERREVRASSTLDVDEAYISRPEPISFRSESGGLAHALFYPPANPDFEAPAGEKPPLVVMSHGGPTSQAWAGLDLGKQLFTSRGFAVVDVDYGGSSGYGREYRRRLEGNWGVVDVADCVSAARHLADAGRVDPERLAIRGGSAGGYTTLCALIFERVFAAGASHFGVGDLEALARDTHKFESRYLDRLVAPYPEYVDVYRQRSPIHFAGRCSCPVIVFQGLDDKVVPPAQAEQLIDALRERGLPYAYLAFEGEGHGFRQADNIRRTLEAELSFYAQVFGFELADEIEPVPVENLVAAARGSA